MRKSHKPKPARALRRANDQLRLEEASKTPRQRLSYRT